MNSLLRKSLAAIVILHFGVVLWHGAAHTQIPVPLTPVQNAFVGFVIVLLPLVGAVLLWTGRPRAGAWLITLSMLGSLLFGLINHFVLASPDYVLAIPADAWRHSFVLSAVLLAVTEGMGAVLGAIAIRT